MPRNHWTTQSPGILIGSRARKKQGLPLSWVRPGAIVGDNLGRPPDRSRHLFFAAASLSLLRFSIEGTIVAVTMPAVTGNHQAPLVWAGWTPTACTLWPGPSLCRWRDGWGEGLGLLRRFLWRAQCCAALRPTFTSPILARVTQALGDGGFLPCRPPASRQRRHHLAVCPLAEGTRGTVYGSQMTFGEPCEPTGPAPPVGTGDTWSELFALPEIDGQVDRCRQGFDYLHGAPSGPESVYLIRPESLGEPVLN